MSELEEALTLQPVADGAWTAIADPRYESANGMFGGWTTAVALRAVLESADPSATPSAITINFIERIDPGTTIAIHTRRIGGSRSISHWSSEVTDHTDRRPLALATIVLTARHETDGLTVATMPTSAPPGTTEVFHPPGTQGQRAIVHLIEGDPCFGKLDTFSTAWVREGTGREVDHLQLAYLADQNAPRSWFWSDAPRLSATMTMSVYFHATAQELAVVGDDFVLNETVATRGAMSTSDQQVRMWSRAGQLLATSQQLCWYR